MWGGCNKEKTKSGGGGVDILTHHLRFRSDRVWSPPATSYCPQSVSRLYSAETRCRPGTAISRPRWSTAPGTPRASCHRTGRSRTRRSATGSAAEAPRAPGAGRGICRSGRWAPCHWCLCNHMRRLLRAAKKRIMFWSIFFRPTGWGWETYS